MMIFKKIQKKPRAFSRNIDGLDPAAQPKRQELPKPLGRELTTVFTVFVGNSVKCFFKV